MFKLDHTVDEILTHVKFPNEKLPVTDKYIQLLKAAQVHTKIPWQWQHVSGVLIYRGEGAIVISKTKQTPIKETEFLTMIDKLKERVYFDYLDIHFEHLNIQSKYHKQTLIK